MHLQVVKLEPVLMQRQVSLVELEPVPPEWKSLARTLQVLVEA
jgi:hypothetical protein